MNGQLIGAVGESNQEDARSPQFERIARVDAARPGDYWRAVKDRIFTDAEGRSKYQVDTGDVLMVADVRNSGAQEHTIVVQYHPLSGTGTFWALTEDFYSVFEHAPDGAAVREAEMRELQAKVSTVQTRIAQALSDPSVMNREIQKALDHERDKEVEPTGGLPARASDLPPVDVLSSTMPSINEAMRAGAGALANQALEVVRGAQERAELEGKWFSRQASEIQKLTGQMTPFLMERAAVAIARNKGAVDKAKSLMESVKTMSLFSGEGVTTTKIVDGAPASQGGSIKLFQRKLWLDEELSYTRAYIGALTVDSFDKFIDELRDNPAFQTLLIPATRGVALVGVSRQRVNGVGDSVAAALQAIKIETANRTSFLLVRDGERFFSIDSPIPSNSSADRLFPEVDVDGSVFNGANGDTITINDLRWTKGLDAIASQKVHYARFAVTLAGQIAKGEFWEGVDFQDLFTGQGNSRLFELVRDDSGEMAIGQQVESVASYISRNNAMVRPGSQVIVDMRRHVDKQTVPRAFSERYDGRRREQYEHQLAEPTDDFVKGTVHAERNAMFVNAEFKKEDGKPVSLRVYLAKEGRSVGAVQTWLALDRLEPMTLDRLMAVRDNRRDFENFMGLFRTVRDASEALLKVAEPDRNRLTQELQAGLQIGFDEAREIALKALDGWRADGNRLPVESAKDWESLQLLAYRLSDAGKVPVEHVAEAAAAKGLVPLRFAVDSGGRLLLHTLDPEPDDRMFKQREVLRWNVEPGKRGIRLTSPSSVYLTKLDPTVTVLHEWDAVADAAIERIPTLSTRRKADIIEDVNARFEKERALVFGPMTDDEQAESVKAFKRAMNVANETGKYVTSPSLRFPVCIAVAGTSASVVTVSISALHLQHNLSDAHREGMREVHMRWYRNKDQAKRDFSGEGPRDIKAFSVQMTPLKDWITGRNAWTSHDMASDWADLRVEILNTRKIEGHADRDFWERKSLDGSGIDLLGRWLKTVGADPVKGRAAMSGWNSNRTVSTVEYPRALQQAFAEGRSLKEALFPSAPPAPSAVDMQDACDEAADTASEQRPS